MTEDHLASSSFGDPNAQPPTPKQTPTSAVFASPVFETPKPYQGSFGEAGGLTPRFAEEYSVFNATPGNLRGTHGPFPDFVPATPGGSTTGHKRLLSAEGFAVEIATHANHFSPNPNCNIPPVAPSHRHPSSPDPSTIHKESASAFNGPLSPVLTKTPSAKKTRRGTVSEAEPIQVISPPPTAKKGERKLAPKLNMQNDHGFSHVDFNDPTQQHDITAFMGSAGDGFSYPLSAPAAAPTNFWDPAMSMGMDMDFATSGANFFQPPTPSSHRHTGSFDWNSDIQLFQDTAGAPPPSSNQENVQPARQERTLAPKPSTSTGEPSMSASFSLPMDDPFGLPDGGDAVNPGLIFSRPQRAAMNAEFGNTAQSGSAEAAIAQSGKAQATDVRRSGSSRVGKAPDRAANSSPVKAAGRPSLGRSVSDNRGRKTGRRGSLPVLAPAARVGSGSVIPASKSTSRLPGRTSPLKTQQRLSSLASIPESSPHSRQRASVRFTIDAHGRARAETTSGDGTVLAGGGMMRSQSSHDLSMHRGWDSPEDSEDSDDEPIIIPSRNGSFAASFALPDPRKPVGSIFHSSRRSISDRSASNSAHDGESEAETVLNEQPGKVGDAASELRKLVEDRHKQSSRGGAGGKPHRHLNTSVRNFPGGIISPTSLSSSSYGPDGFGVRCVCNNSKGDDGEAFMVQCESCEMWLHGKCINISRRTMPSVYICGFCANTPNMANRRTRDSGRDNALGIGSAVSPLANKSFRSFR